MGAYLVVGGLVVVAVLVVFDLARAGRVRRAERLPRSVPVERRDVWTPGGLDLDYRGPGRSGLDRAAADGHAAGPRPRADVPADGAAVLAAASPLTAPEVQRQALYRRFHDGVAARPDLFEPDPVDLPAAQDAVREAVRDSWVHDPDRATRRGLT